MTDPGHTKRERSIAGALLLSERDAQRAMMAIVKRRSLDLGFAIQLGMTDAKLHAEVRRHVDEMADELEGEVSKQATAARADARITQKKALAALLLLAGGERPGADATLRRSLDNAIGRLSAEVPVDAVRARVAGQALANSWAQSVMRKVTPASRAARQEAAPTPAGPYRTAGTRADYETAAEVSKRVPVEVEPAVARTAATETATAHNSEAKRIYESLPTDIQDLLELQWSAVLDKRTCPACEAKDGKIVTSEFPPLHPNCRCVTVPIRRQGVRRAA